MSERSTEQIRELLDSLYRVDSGRILATLIRLLGDLDVAEEAMNEAFAAALDTWPQAGVPDKPRPWLNSTARFKAINGMRRRAPFDSAEKDLALYLEARINEAPHEDEEIEDDRLRLIFTYCHPALPPEGQVATKEPLGGAIRTSTLRSRSVSHVSVLTRVLVLPATGCLISQRAP